MMTLSALPRRRAGLAPRRFFRRMVRRSLTRRRSRVLIAVAAVGIGATTLSGLALLSLDIPRHMSRDLRGYGANLVVTPSQEASAIPAAAVDSLTQALPAGSVVSATAWAYATVRLNNQPYVAAGVDMAAARAAKAYWSIDGDWPQGVGAALVGRDIAEWIGLRPGDPLTLTFAREAEGTAAEVEAGGQAETGPETGAAASPGTATGTETDTAADAEVAPEAEAGLTVAGVLQTGGAEDSMIVLPLADWQALTGASGAFDVVEYAVDASPEALQGVAEAVNAAVGGVVAAPVKRLERTEADVLGMLRSLMLLITVIVLALTMIGVATTMTAVVTERRSEIALRKALGASDRSIQREFWAEAMALGAAGGLLGAFAGWGLANVISQNVFHRPVGLVWWVVCVTVVVAIGVARAACQRPVSKAAGVDPAIVLREE